MLCVIFILAEMFHIGLNILLQYTFISNWKRGNHQKCALNAARRSQEMTDVMQINRDWRKPSCTNCKATEAGLKEKDEVAGGLPYMVIGWKRTAESLQSVKLRMNGTTYSNFDNQEHVLKLGETFERHPKSAFHTVRCKWRFGTVYRVGLAQRLNREANGSWATSDTCERSCLLESLIRLVSLPLSARLCLLLECSQFRGCRRNDANV